MPRLKVGIIGAGMAFERLHYPAYQRLKDQYQIVAVCDADLARAKTWAERLHLGQEQAYADFQTMLAWVDLDVVDIMVPIPLNYQVTAEVARAPCRQAQGNHLRKAPGPHLVSGPGGQGSAPEVRPAHHDRRELPVQRRSKPHPQPGGSRAHW